MLASEVPKWGPWRSCSEVLECRQVAHRKPKVDYAFCQAPRHMVRHVAKSMTFVEAFCRSATSDKTYPQIRSALGDVSRGWGFHNRCDKRTSLWELWQQQSQRPTPNAMRRCCAQPVRLGPAAIAT